MASATGAAPTHHRPRPSIASLATCACAGGTTPAGGRACALESANTATSGFACWRKALVAESAFDEGLTRRVSYDGSSRGAIPTYSCLLAFDQWSVFVIGSLLALHSVLSLTGMPSREVSHRIRGVGPLAPPPPSPLPLEPRGALRGGSGGGCGRYKAGSRGVCSSAAANAWAFLRGRPRGGSLPDGHSSRGACGAPRNKALLAACDVLGRGVAAALVVAQHPWRVTCSVRRRVGQPPPAVSGLHKPGWRWCTRTVLSCGAECQGSIPHDSQPLDSLRPSRPAPRDPGL
eukprot:365149-Chlamydomonas_euryale.AAC.9